MGLSTPRLVLLVSGVLFVVCGVARISLGEITRHVWPFVAAMYLLLLVCMLVPSLVLALPRALGF